MIYGMSLLSNTHITNARAIACALCLSVYLSTYELLFYCYLMINSNGTRKLTILHANLFNIISHYLQNIIEFFIPFDVLLMAPNSRVTFLSSYMSKIIIGRHVKQVHIKLFIIF